MGAVPKWMYEIPYDKSGYPRWCIGSYFCIHRNRPVSEVREPRLRRTTRETRDWYGPDRVMGESAARPPSNIIAEAVAGREVVFERFPE